MAGQGHEPGEATDETQTKRKRFTEERIVVILKEAAASDDARLVVRKHGITETSFSPWKAKYSGIGVPEEECGRSPCQS